MAIQLHRAGIGFPCIHCTNCRQAESYPNENTYWDTRTSAKNDQCHCRVNLRSRNIVLERPSSQRVWLSRVGWPLSGEQSAKPVPTVGPHLLGLVVGLDTALFVRQEELLEVFSSPSGGNTNKESCFSFSISAKLNCLTCLIA